MLCYRGAWGKVNIRSDRIRVRSLTFSLDDNLDRADQTFFKNL
ncbi:MAG: hypothetical protein RM368_21200 [Nostoc sp. DedSLP03]|nr:hypothetical protein [Nostoc sp. DedSLP03]